MVLMYLNRTRQLSEYLKEQGKGLAMDNKLLEKRSECRKTVEQYHSVEILIEGLDLPYQFKLWDVTSQSMSVLVKEGSSVLPFLKVGDILEAKYYSFNSIYPSKNVHTAIRHITKNDQGRLKGHYLIGLKIVKE